MTDSLPNEPGGYIGYEVLFGHKYVAPQLGAGTPSLSRNGYEITNAAGNLVDLNGNQINGAFDNGNPGFPGFGTINAAQTLAYMSDMLESGVPVVQGYIADLHGNEFISSLSRTTRPLPPNPPVGKRNSGRRARQRIAMPRRCNSTSSLPPT